MVTIKPTTGLDEMYKQTDEEKAVLAKNPETNLIVYHANNHNYKRMLVNMNYLKSEIDLLDPYTKNPSFKNLMENKLIKNNPDRIMQLTSIIYTLGQKSADLRKEVNSPNYRSTVIPDTKNMYASIDVNNCIKNIDTFFSSKFSDDLKLYMLFDGNKLKDLWYNETTLGKLEPDCKDVSKLFNTYYLM